MEADTTRDAVAAAFKEVASRVEPSSAPEPAAEPAPEPSSAAPAPEAETKEAKESAARDGKGRFIVPPKQKPAASERLPASTVPAGQGGAVSVPPPAQVAAPPAPKQPELKPPQDWRLSAREKWASLPKEVQEEALRLHVETKKTLSEMAEVRKGYDGYAKAVTPYEAMIRAEGLEPHAAVGLLLQREAALRTAPMQMRAKILAHGIRSFLGTDDAAIDLLAQELKGEPGNGAHGPQASFDPRQLIAQAKQEFAREFETRRNEMVSTSAQGEIESFAQSHEFMDDVDPETGLTLAEDMANLLAAQAEKGKALSLDDAYKLATKRHSDVSKVFAQREAAKAATAKAATTQAARAASSSIRSEPAGPSNGKPKDVREAVAEAYYAQKNAR